MDEDTEEEVVSPDQDEKAKSTSRLDNIKSKYQVNVLGDLQKIISDVPESVTQNELLELSIETIQSVWNNTLQHLKEYTSSVFIDAAKRATISWKEPSTIVAVIESKLAEGVMRENKTNLASALSLITKRTDIEVEFVLNKKVEQEIVTSKYLTPKEIFKQMVERNPHLLDLQKKLDLDID